jgi:glycosyltransferase involved in cell wall biosynthesis
VALSGAIEKVINDRSLGQRLGQTGYERVKRLFSIENNARRLSALLSGS